MSLKECEDVKKTIMDPNLFWNLPPSPEYNMT